MFYDDEFSGQGGSFLQDAVTGKRTRIEAPTQDMAPSPAAEPAVARAEETPTIADTIDPTQGV